MVIFLKTGLVFFLIIAIATLGVISPLFAKFYFWTLILLPLLALPKQIILKKLLQLTVIVNLFAYILENWNFKTLILPSQYAYQNYQYLLNEWTIRLPIWLFIFLLALKAVTLSVSKIILQKDTKLLNSKSNQSVKK